jgi:hypothetical protein
MLTPVRARKTALIGAIAACAAIGATSPVWAGTGSSPSPATVGDQTTTADAATIAAMQAHVAQLKTTLASDEAALAREARADHAAAQAAHVAMADAAKWKTKSERTKTHMVTVQAPATSTDPVNQKRCHHGTDPGDWMGHGHDGSHGSDSHHFHGRGQGFQH